jgi:DNA-binding transcriptional regulator GbsR (MarR family)
MKTDEIKKSIYNAFSDIASSIGYSDMHGRIIAALLTNNNRLSLQELAEETGYSLSTISLSLDFLELLGMIKKAKNVGDRKLYVELQGDLLEGLKRAFVLNLQKNIGSTLGNFDKYREELRHSKDEKSKKVMKTLDTLEREIKRLENYINLLSKLRLP